MNLQAVEFERPPGNAVVRDVYRRAKLEAVYKRALARSVYI